MIRRTPVMHLVALLGAVLVGSAHAKDALQLAIPVTPGRPHHVRARLNPEAARALVEGITFFPGFRPLTLIECGERVVDVCPIGRDGEIEFDVAAATVGSRVELSLSVTPSAAVTPQGNLLPWTCELVRAEPGDADASRYTADIGHPTDTAFAGRGFSYQEGAGFQYEAWVCDENFRWTDNGFHVRVPIAPGGRHEITFRGNVPVGFEVHSGDRLLARFEQPNEPHAYTFAVDGGVGSPDGWLALRVDSTSPFPPPNLDLRTLFWALNKIEVTSHGSTRIDPDAVPPGSLAEIAFRAALSAAFTPRQPLRLSLRAVWDSPAGWKTPVQVRQEAILAVCRGAMPQTVSQQPERAARALSVALRDALTAAGATADTPDAAEVANWVADVGIYIPSRQWDAYRARPSNNYGLLLPAFGACVMLHELETPCKVVTDGDLAAGAHGLRCLILPSVTFMRGGDWTDLRRFVEAGGTLITVAGLSLPRGDDAGDSSALLGAAVREYYRRFLSVRIDDEWVRLYNADWEAEMARTTAKPALPLLTSPSATPTGAEPPAVALNEIGRGRCALICFDVFDQYIRYGNPGYRRLVAWVLRQFVSPPLVRVEGSSLAVPAVREAADHLVVGVLNVARGEFDHGGLMNSSRTAVFAEQIPELGPLRVAIRCTRRVNGVRLIADLPADGPHGAPTTLASGPSGPDLRGDDALNHGWTWSWSDGELVVQLSSLKLYFAVRAELEP